MGAADPRRQHQAEAGVNEPMFWSHEPRAGASRNRCCAPQNASGVPGEMAL
jgi:hypothetical protein